jgi:hypothetical protein
MNIKTGAKTITTYYLNGPVHTTPGSNSTPSPPPPPPAYCYLMQAYDAGLEEDFWHHDLLRAQVYLNRNNKKYLSTSGWRFETDIPYTCLEVVRGDAIMIELT